MLTLPHTHPPRRKLKYAALVVLAYEDDAFSDFVEASGIDRMVLSQLRLPSDEEAGALMDLTERDDRFAQK
jgi:hypothetical protein